MLSKLTIRDFKLFQGVEIELGERVVFIGPKNSGKTSALQAIVLWDVGVKRWLEKRGSGNISAERADVTINRQDVSAIPAPAANLLWRDLHVRGGKREESDPQRTRNVRIEIGVEGVNEKTWYGALELPQAGGVCADECDRPRNSGHARRHRGYGECCETTQGDK